MRINQPEEFAVGCYIKSVNSQTNTSTKVKNPANIYMFQLYRLSVAALLGFKEKSFYFSVLYKLMCM